jgi:hypothetical protein
MIRYTLQCDDGHSFDSWFASASAFEALDKAGHLSCTECGSTAVKKSLMAPRVSTAQKDDTTLPVLSEPQSDREKAVEAMRAHVETHSDYVGKDFATQARAMHDGEAPERAIHGVARLDQAKKLVEDGVPVVPLPFAPKQKLS